MELKVAYNGTTKTVSVLNTADDIPAGSVNIGTFNHPDLVYPDSVVIYHGVRDLLYKRSAENPSELAMYPHNICNMQEITILPVSEYVPPYFVLQPPAIIDKSESPADPIVEATGFATNADLYGAIYDSSNELMDGTTSALVAGAYTIVYFPLPNGTGYRVGIEDTVNNVIIFSNPFDIVA